MFFLLVGPYFLTRPGLTRIRGWYYPITAFLRWTDPLLTFFFRYSLFLISAVIKWVLLGSFLWPQMVSSAGVCKDRKQWPKPSKTLVFCWDLWDYTTPLYRDCFISHCIRIPEPEAIRISKKEGWIMNLYIMQGCFWVRKIATLEGSGYLGIYEYITYKNILYIYICFIYILYIYAYEITINRSLF